MTCLQSTCTVPSVASKRDWQAFEQILVRLEIEFVLLRLWVRWCWLPRLVVPSHFL
ncbi:hypothetical protein D3C80_2013080 [compost metagenome]